MSAPAINLLTWRPEDEGMYSQVEFANRYLSGLDEVEVRSELARRGRQVRESWANRKAIDSRIQTEQEIQARGDAERAKIELRRAAQLRAKAAKARADHLSSVLGVRVSIRGKLPASAVDAIGALVESLRVLADADDLSPSEIHARAERIERLRA